MSDTPVQSEWRDTLEALWQLKNQHEDEYVALGYSPGYFWGNEKVKELCGKLFSQVREEVKAEQLRAIIELVKNEPANTEFSKEPRQAIYFKDDLLRMLEALTPENIRKETNE